ncbi:MAG: TIGR00725 family protein [Sphingomonas hengshuiensis]|uniref:TIGR00725 family protein n=1 Tax=Sphingomonas hengshuiensis TaxID=1609977 RepID=A0A2W5B7G4_9SPHN|nr:MAG: TIGR00725 family protein [Sphingomonas hengshuiensis]
MQYDEAAARLWSERGMFDAGRHDWMPTDGPATGSRVDLASASDAVERIGRHGRLLPVGVIGGRDASEDQCRIAFDMGRALAGAGFPVMTGGKGGIMQAACEGAATAGGLTIGILPDNEWTGANPFVTVPIATGLGSARNAIIARACFALVAVGGEYGTQTEMAFGMHFGRLVLAFGPGPAVAGVVAVRDTDDAIERIACRYLSLDDGGIDASDDGVR